MEPVPSLPQGALPVIETAGSGDQRLSAGESRDPQLLGRQIVESLVHLPAAIVAFSGGVDSGLVAAAAVRALGRQRTLAVTAVSVALPSGEREQAAAMAGRIGIPHREIAGTEQNDPRYVANSGNRCYWCKTNLYAAIRAAVDLDWPVLNGTNADDLGDYRPGLRAASEHGVCAPLAEMGMTKAEVRAVAKTWGLPEWNKPAGPCLASRIAPGVAVTAERLRMVDAAEQMLRKGGFRVCRVRLYEDGLARIEVERDQVPEAARWLDRPGHQAALLDLGFRRIELDPAGFRSGSLNELARAVAARTCGPAASGRSS